MESTDEVDVAYMLNKTISNLEYAGCNLTNDIEKDVSRIVESTCPETCLLIALRDIKFLLAHQKEGSTNETSR